jgi:hypothetical protein
MSVGNLNFGSPIQEEEQENSNSYHLDSAKKKVKGRKGSESFDATASKGNTTP